MVVTDHLKKLSPRCAAVTATTADLATSDAIQLAREVNQKRAGWHRGVHYERCIFYVGNMLSQHKKYRCINYERCIFYVSVFFMLVTNEISC